jgi:hypothetical protein
MRVGDGAYRALSPDALQKLPDYFAEEFEAALNAAGEKMLANLRALYERVVRERPRFEGARLRRVIMQAMSDYVARYGDQIELGVFDLEFVKTTTHSELYGTEKQPRSLFEILEEGYGPNDEYGWCPHDLALELAEQCLNVLGVPHVNDADQRSDFLIYVDNAFFGRHGDGIMVKLTEPLFYRFPAFGTPLEHGILPHAGWAGWHVLDQAGNTPNGGGFNVATGEVHWMTEAIEEAMKKAAQRVQSI